MELYPEQREAFDKISSFIANPNQRCFILEGFAGTGKTTLISSIFRNLDNIIEVTKLLNPSAKNVPVDFRLTATTNKAAEALESISGTEVKTIHSFLGLRVFNDFKTGETKLVPSKKYADIPEDILIFIDEASYIDEPLAKHIFKRIPESCKILFIGDPAQLTPVKCTHAPIFNYDFPRATLTQVVRQAEGSPIIQLATNFRNVVNGQEFFSFEPDGIAISHVSRNDFDDLIIDEFTGEQTKNNARVLGWTNKLVQDYNRTIRKKVTGHDILHEGQWAVCNSYYQLGKTGLKTDSIVQLRGVDRDIEKYPGIPDIALDVLRINLYGHIATMPVDHTEAKAYIRKLKKFLTDTQGTEYATERTNQIKKSWIDLRDAYACTINKSQGSTYKRVYIDLDDIKRCRMGTQMARLLYVAVSRASEKVILTGDLV